MTLPLPLTAGRRVALAVGVPLALLTIGWTALTAVALVGEGSYRVNLDLPAHGHTVTVAVDSGDVSISPAAGNQIRVRGTARWALIRSRVTWQSTSSGVVVRSRCQQPTGSCSFDYRVTLPGSLTTVISSGSGDVTVTGLAGHALLQDGSGDIRASALSGGVEIKDQSGQVTGASLSGPRVLVENDSGDIAITGLASPDVTTTNHSGNITLIFTRVPQRVVVSDQSGDVRLVLPPGPTLYRVSASTQSGQTSVRVPTSSASSHVVTVTDQSGNITVTQ
jgi:hypothetical protein